MGLMFDGATDTSVLEVELVYVRYVINGQARNQYLRCQPLDHAHADGVFHAIDRAFRDIGIDEWRSTIVGVGCDGATVNMGARNSVITRIKDGTDYIVKMHCVAHRMELNAADTAGDNAHGKHFADIRLILQLMYKHYHESPKAMRDLKSVADAMGEKKHASHKTQGHPMDATLS